jgi:hypothetical protein
MKLWAKLLLISLFSLYIYAGIYGYYDEIQESKKIEEKIQYYKNNWSLNSIHECKLINIYKNTTISKPYVVTKSNRDSYNNGTFKIIIGESFITINSPKKEITARQTAWINKENLDHLSPSKLSKNLDYLGDFAISPNEYSYEDREYIFSYYNIHIIKNNEINEYKCNKVTSK